MKLVRRQVLLTFVAGLVVLASATAAGAAPARTAASANLCTVAKGVGRSFTKLPSSQSLTAAKAQAAFRTNVAKLAAAKGALVGAAPSSLKPDVRTAIAFLVLLKADLTKVGWSYAALATKPAMVAALQKSELRSRPAIARLSRYWHKTCE